MTNRKDKDPLAGAVFGGPDMVVPMFTPSGPKLYSLAREQVIGDEDALVRGARRTGLSDGYYGYPADPGDYAGRARKAYLDAHAEGKAKNRNGRAW